MSLDASCASKAVFISFLAVFFAANSATAKDEAKGTKAMKAAAKAKEAKDKGEAEQAEPPEPRDMAVWKSDRDHSRAIFSVAHLKFSTVTGSIGGLDAVVEEDKKDILKSNVTATLDVDTLSTGVGEDKRDHHLKSDDFLAAAKFPKIKFISTKLDGEKGKPTKVKGKLTIRDVTKDVVLHIDLLSPEIKNGMGKPMRVFKAHTTINRQDYGVKWSKVVEALPLVGDDVKIELVVELVKQETGA
jgi:polyisoprenoid-binding protein YceI